MVFFVRYRVELTSLLQGHKRTADFSLITDSPAKRLATAKAILVIVCFWLYCYFN